MHKVIIEETEAWDPVNETFVEIPRREFMIEHSLISVSKWESKWHKFFLSTDKTPEEWIDYVRCMTISSNVPDEAYRYLTRENLIDIDQYISNPMTATRVKDKRTGGGSQDISNELIYSWMVDLGIPFECEKWHLNRLLMLIRVCSVNGTGKKMSKKDIFAQNKALNQARRAKYHSKG